MRTSRLFLLLAAAAAFSGTSRAAGIISYGTLCNFDVINDTEVIAMGLRSNSMGLRPQMLSTHSALRNQRYGNPSIAATATGVSVRYEAA